MLSGIVKAAAIITSFVTIVNPVRGGDFWSLENQKPLTAVKAQKEILEKHGFSATWLLRPDVVFDSEMTDYFQNFLPGHELGIFLEITPTWTEKAGVKYHQNVLWHYANSVFLSGYTTNERQLLIDTAFEQFHQIFGFYPQSVGAWHVDAYSASYMKEKYNIEAVLICADQFSTDGYQIWGQPWSVSYYPSKFNILVPAQTTKNKLDLVVFQWAARDPGKGYGGGVEESTFSVQANDYLKHGLTTDYFSHLVDVYTQTDNPFGQITVGLENDNDWEKFGREYENQIKAIKVKTATMAQFSAWYKEHFPKISPQIEIKSKKARWISSPELRIGFISGNDQGYIRDLRIYNEKWPEPYLLTANPWPDLNLSVPAKIDTVRFPESIKPYTQEFVQSKLTLPFSSPKTVLLFYCFTVLLIFTFLFLKHKWLGILVLLGTLTQSLTMIKSGFLYPFGMGFWGPNGHDGVWHLALINQLSRFSFSHPTFAGEKLANYHFGFDLLVAFLHKISRIPAHNLYFQILPPIFSILLGVLTYKLVKKWTGNKTAAFWSTFFVYFGGSFGWMVTFLRRQELGGESMFWANQAISTLINPPFALSLVLLLMASILLLDYLKKPKRSLLIILALLFGGLIQVKVYGGIVALGGLGILGTLGNFGVLKLFFASLLVSFLVFLPFNLRAGSLLAFSPFWFPHTMLVFQDRLSWTRLANARQAWLATGNYLKWLAAEILALFIFLVGNLGTRVIGFFSFRKSGLLNFFSVTAGIGLILSLLFVQKGNPWNTIQFFYYFLFIFSLLAGITFAKLIKNKNLFFKGLLILILVLLTVPTTLSTLKSHYLPSRAPARISFEELEALEFLKNQPQGTVLTYPFNPDWREKFSEPRPLYAYETTAYVSAFSGKRTFLEDEMNLEISGYNWQPRRQAEVRFFATSDREWAREFLGDNKIRYIYLVKGQKMNLGEDDIGAQKIFENGGVKIYQVRDKI